MTIGCELTGGEKRTGAHRAGWFLVACLGLLAGCGKPEPRAPEPATMAPTVLAVHWAGKLALAQDTNAAYQMEIWKLPESEALEQQTLDKLARALPRLLDAAATNPPPELLARLRPLLDDLVQNEIRFELRAPTNAPREFSLAVRLAEDRTGLWRTNVATFAAALTGVSVNPSATASAWQARRLRPPLTLQFAETNGWIALDLSTEGGPAFADFTRRLTTNAAPPASSDPLWLELDADLSHFLQIHFTNTAPRLPALHLTLAGEGQNVRTRGELTFAQPLNLTLAPWTVPTNLIHDPLISFTAIRGMQGWLESSLLWQRLVGGPAPREHYFWGVRGMPFETYAAAVWPGSSNAFFLATENLKNHMNAALTNDWGEVTRMPDTNGIVWSSNPFLKAHLRHDVGPLGEIVSGGFFELPEKGHPIPDDLLNQFVPHTNLLYYDWEITQARVFTWIQVPSFLRMVFNKAQLSEETAGLKWLLAAMPKLGNAGTTIQLLDANRLTISRVSSVGFTGAELQLLMDWLESPNFPSGLRSFDAPVKNRRARATGAVQSGAVTTSTNAEAVR